MPDSPLEVEFRRSGGIAGIDLAATAGAQDLRPEHVDLLSTLLSSDQADPAGRPPGPDQFSYQLTVRQGGRTRTFQWTDAQVPDQLRPVLASLAARAQPAPPR